MSDRPLVAPTSLWWITLLGLVAVATTANAQSTARDQPHTPRPGTGTIRGRVVRADTGEPLRRGQKPNDEKSGEKQSGALWTPPPPPRRDENPPPPPAATPPKTSRGGGGEEP